MFRAVVAGSPRTTSTDGTYASPKPPPANERSPRTPASVAYDRTDWIVVVISDGNRRRHPTACSSSERAASTWNQSDIANVVIKTLRIRRFARIAIPVLAVLGLVAWLVPPQISRWQTRKALEQQAAAIAAHREAQRATPAATPAPAPTVTTSAP